MALNFFFFSFFQIKEANLASSCSPSKENTFWKSYSLPGKTIQLDKNVRLKESFGTYHQALNSILTNVVSK